MYCRAETQETFLLLLLNVTMGGVRNLRCPTLRGLGSFPVSAGYCSGAGLAALQLREVERVGTVPPRPGLSRAYGLCSIKGP